MSDPAVKGVAFEPPPAEHLPSIKTAIDTAIATLPPGKRVALVSVFNQSGANAAFVAKVGGAWEVYSWVGKRWGADLEYGASVRASW